MTEGSTTRHPWLAASTWLRQPVTLAQLVILGAILFAYRRLFIVDPNLHASTNIDPVEEWFFATSGGTSPFLIYALTAWFVARRSHILLNVDTEASIPSTIVGAGGILFAIGLVVWSDLTSATQILPPSLALLLVSTGLFLAGCKGGRSLLIPAMFLFLLGTPIPPPLLNYVIYPMQLAAADASVSIVRLCGYPVLQAGDLILTNWAIFQVIETCAGLRSVLTLLMAAFVYCELLEVPRWQRGVLILAAPVIGLATNIMRVVFLIFIPIPESQPAHSIQGIVMTIVGVLILALLHEALRRLFRERSQPHNKAPTTPSDVRIDGKTSRRIYALAFVLTATGLASLRIEPWEFPHDNGPDVHAIPREIGPWHTGQNPLIVDAEYLGSVRFSSRTWRNYQRGDEFVSVFAAVNNRILRSAGIVSEKTITLEAGAVRGPALPADDELDDDDGQSVMIRTRNGESQAVRHWYENTAGLWTETLRSMFAIDRSPWRRRDPARVVRIATAIDASTGGKAGAERRLQEFSTLIRKELERLQPRS